MSASATLQTTEAGAIALVHALSGMHPGSGRALGSVDLPVQRETHTHWPVVPGSSLKGVLRDRFGSSEHVTWLFGPERGADNDGIRHAGALSVGDLFTIAFPVRSMTGVFAWVTCRDALRRLHMLGGLAGVGDMPELPGEPGAGTARVPDGCACVIGGDMIVLEEYDYPAALCARTEEWATWLANAFRTADSHTADRLVKTLVLLPGEEFGYFVEHATEVAARIAIDSETKTVARGALFYQEFLPPETLFAGSMLAHRSRSGNGREAADAIRELMTLQGAVLQLGGNETIGKGLCRMHMVSGGGR